MGKTQGVRAKRRPKPKKRPRVAHRLPLAKVAAIRSCSLRGGSKDTADAGAGAGAGLTMTEGLA